MRGLVKKFQPLFTYVQVHYTHANLVDRFHNSVTQWADFQQKRVFSEAALDPLWPHWLGGELWLIRPKEYLLAPSPEHLLHQTLETQNFIYFCLSYCTAYGRTILYIKILDVFG